MGHGFERLGEEELHAGFRLRLAKGRFRSPDGQEFERDIVHHPGAVGVVPLHDDGTVTLVRQYRAALDAEILEVPAGLRDVDGEADEATAHRELAEEDGLAADHLEHLVTFHNSPGFSDEDVAVFVARGLRPVDHDPQGIEEAVMTIERHPLEDCLAMIGDGRITDSKTVIGLAVLAVRQRPR